MTSSAYAWILTDNSGHSFAVADVQMAEYLTEATVKEVPLSPDYCPGIMPWRGRLLPVVYFDRIFDPDLPKVQNHIMVLAYQQQPGEPIRHLAVVVGRSPYRIIVTEQESEALPELYDETEYRPLVLSVFSHNETAIPVIDVNYLASPVLRDLLQKKPRAVRI